MTIPGVGPLATTAIAAVIARGTVIANYAPPP